MIDLLDKQGIIRIRSKTKRKSILSLFTVMLMLIICLGTFGLTVSAAEDYNSGKDTYDPGSMEAKNKLRDEQWSYLDATVNATFANAIGNASAYRAYIFEQYSADKPNSGLPAPFRSGGPERYPAV